MLNVFSPSVSERATVQVPTGLHSQTDVTGWSNYWVADTPAWLGFISSRKRDSQITVYPHRAPSSGLIPQLQMMEPHTDTLTPYSHMRAHTPTCLKALCWYARLPTATENGVFSPVYSVQRSVHVQVCHHMPWLSPFFLSNTPTSTIKARGNTVLCRCLSERERERTWDRWHQSTV